MDTRSLENRGVDAVVGTETLDPEAGHGGTGEESGDQFSLCTRALRRELVTVDEFVPEHRATVIYAVAHGGQCSVEAFLSVPSPSKPSCPRAIVAINGIERRFERITGERQSASYFAPGDTVRLEGRLRSVYCLEGCHLKASRSKLWSGRSRDKNDRPTVIQVSRNRRWSPAGKPIDE